MVCKNCKDFGEISDWHLQHFREAIDKDIYSSTVLNKLISNASSEYKDKLAEDRLALWRSNVSINFKCCDNFSSRFPGVNILVEKE